MTPKDSYDSGFDCTSSAGTPSHGVTLAPNASPCRSSEAWRTFKGLGEPSKQKLLFWFFLSCCLGIFSKSGKLYCTSSCVCVLFSSLWTCSLWILWILLPLRIFRIWCWVLRHIGWWPGVSRRQTSTEGPVHQLHVPARKQNDKSILGFGANLRESIWKNNMHSCTGPARSDKFWMQNTSDVIHVRYRIYSFKFLKRFSDVSCIWFSFFHVSCGPRSHSRISPWDLLSRTLTLELGLQWKMWKASKSLSKRHKRM